MELTTLANPSGPASPSARKRPTRSLTGRTEAKRKQNADPSTEATARARGTKPGGKRARKDEVPSNSPPRPSRRRKTKDNPRRTASSPPTIMVATADPSLARMLTFALEQVRLAHRLFSSGSLFLNELLAMPVGSRAPIVVLDVDLPGVDGHAILERLGVARPDTFIILVLSSHADESVQVRSVLSGAVDHLSKPFNIRILIAKLQRWAALLEHQSAGART